MPNRRRVSSLDKMSGKFIPVADFWMKSGKLNVEWFDLGLVNLGRLRLEGGIVTKATGRVKISDGKAFFDALPLALSYGSAFYVDDIKT